MDKARLDVLNVQGGHAGQPGVAKNSRRDGEFPRLDRTDHASGNYDLTQLKAGGNFKKSVIGSQLSDAHLNLFGHMIDAPTWATRSMRPAGGNVDLLHGQANGNLSLAGSSVNFLRVTTSRSATGRRQAAASTWAKARPTSTSVVATA